jgi:CRP/FNR family transcriptional regulator, cyclic AMP receptor protein
MGVCLSDREKAIGAALRGTLLFAGWPSEVLRTLSVQAQMWRYEKGEIIAERGDPATGLWAAASGSVNIYRRSVRGGYFLQGITWPGDVFALTSAVDGVDFPLSYAARTDTHVVFVPRPAFLAGLRGSEERMIHLLKYLCARTRVEYEGAHAMVLDSVRCRLAKTLAFLMRRSLFLPKGNPSPVDLSQNEIADMLGLSRQTLNRAVVGLIREGVIARKDNTLQVVDFQALLAVMEETEPVHEIWRSEILSWDRKHRGEA